MRYLILSFSILYYIPGNTQATYPDVRIAGAMRNVMWEGKLGSIIDLDTISDREGLYALGPLSYLEGELLVLDGQAYVAKVIDTMAIEVNAVESASAPFLVYANVHKWKQTALPDTVQDIASLEHYLTSVTREMKQPFAFKLSGGIQNAEIHIQDLPAGVEVHSPAEVHQGQVNFTIDDVDADIVGFYSTRHQGVFTHHDSYTHMHLITKDRKTMGHLDHIVFDPENIQLYLPVN